jgi:hypothetical protein
MKKKLKWILIALVVVFGLLQLTNPDRTNPPVTPGNDLFAVSPPPAQVAALVRTSCFDCHSQETKWPWYSRVAPMSWTVAHDVEEGRERLNFSDWPVNDPARAARKFGNISDVVGSGEMPLKKYTMIHRDAILSDAQRKLIEDWADAQADRLNSGTPAAKNK